MYVAVPEYYKDLIDGGFEFRPVRTLNAHRQKQWLKTYYHHKNE